jgi:hypothetical protein
LESKITNLLPVAVELARHGWWAVIVMTVAYTVKHVQPTRAFLILVALLARDECRRARAERIVISIWGALQHDRSDEAEEE